ncbi:hypothetical protein M0804_003785 [Polistes exclamans]|nr:hypothetical protein M0804_003785 [Polistes exclamans]
MLLSSSRCCRRLAKGNPFSLNQYHQRGSNANRLRSSRPLDCPCARKLNFQIKFQPKSNDRDKETFSSIW